MPSTKTTFSIALYGTLLGILGIAGLAATIPFAFLSYAAPQSSLFVAPMTFALVGLLAVPLAMIMYVRDAGDKALFRMPYGYDNLLVGVGIVSGLLALGALVNVALMFAGCGSTYTAEGVAQYIFDETCAELNATLTVGSLPLYRRPNFAMNMFWYQGCLDEIAVVIFLIIDYAAIALASFIVAGNAFGRRAETLKMTRL
jgi:hypothetical protein